MMLFGYINEAIQEDASGTSRINIGDYIQFYALHRLLSSLGIPETRIVGLNRKDISSYHGPEMIFVLNNLFGILELPKNMHPVYLAYNGFGFPIEREEIGFLTSMRGIGCRDERGYELIKRFHPNAYINGCVSITLPRKSGPLGDRVYLVDIPTELLPHIPDDILSQAEIKTHEYYFNRVIDNKEAKSISYQQYKEYYNHAKLVVTSRLHLVAPCVAWGIPVICIRQNPFITFSWIDRYIPLYTPEKYESIDWNPKPLDIEYEKSVIRRDMSYQIFKEYYQYVSVTDTHALYSDRRFAPGNGYYKRVIEGLCKRIEEKFKENDAFQYAIWGITRNAELLLEYMNKKYKNAVLTDAIDRYKSTIFHGMNTKKPEEVDYRNKYVFVIPTGAVQEAKDFLQDKPCLDYFFATERFATQADVNDEQIRRGKGWGNHCEVEG